MTDNLSSQAKRSAALVGVGCPTASMTRRLVVQTAGMNGQEFAEFLEVQHLRWHPLHEQLAWLLKLWREEVSEGNHGGASQAAKMIADRLALGDRLLLGACPVCDGDLWPVRIEGFTDICYGDCVNGHGVIDQMSTVIVDRCDECGSPVRVRPIVVNGAEHMLCRACESQW